MVSGPHSSNIARGRLFDISREDSSAQILNFVRSNIPELKYQRFTQPGCKDVGISNLELVAKSQFLHNYA